MDIERNSMSVGRNNNRHIEKFVLKIPKKPYWLYNYNL